MDRWKVGLTFGVFDLFHIGHLNLLKQAKAKCDYLIVCVSSDRYVEEHKKKSPIFLWEDRMEIVSACRYVDTVSVQSIHFTKKDAVERFKPDVLFVGDDWTKDTYTGEGLGVPVVYLKHTDGISTTLLLEDIKLQK